MFIVKTGRIRQFPVLMYIYKLNVFIAWVDNTDLLIKQLHFSFRSRKYDDKFAEALSGVLPKLQSLKQLEWVSWSKQYFCFFIFHGVEQLIIHCAFHIITPSTAL